MDSCSQFSRSRKGFFPQKVNRRTSHISLPFSTNISHSTSLRLLKQLLSTFVPLPANSSTILATFDCVSAGKEARMGCRDWLVLMRWERKMMKEGGVSISYVWGMLQIVSRADRVQSRMWAVKVYSESRASQDFRISEATSIKLLYNYNHQQEQGKMGLLIDVFYEIVVFQRKIGSLGPKFPGLILATPHHLEIEEQSLVFEVSLQGLLVPLLQDVDVVHFFLEVALPHRQVLPHFVFPRTLKLHSAPIAHPILVPASAGQRYRFRFVLLILRSVLIEGGQFLLQNFQFSLQGLLFIGYFIGDQVFGVEGESLRVGEVVMNIIEEVLALCVFNITISHQFRLSIFLTIPQFFLQLVHLLLQAVGEASLGLRRVVVRQH